VPYSSETARMLAAERLQLDICCYQATPAYELRLLLERTEGRVVGMRYSGWGIPDIWIGWAANPGRSQGATAEKANAVSGALSIDPIHIKKGQEGACQIVQIFCEDAGRPREANET
jgi:hypothetical protein